MNRSDEYHVITPRDQQCAQKITLLGWAPFLSSPLEIAYFMTPSNRSVKLIVEWFDYYYMAHN